jgi:hypothetical protein
MKQTRRELVKEFKSILKLGVEVMKHGAWVLERAHVCCPSPVRDSTSPVSPFPLF